MNNRKTRTPIPKDLAADTLYAFDRTCCVCNEKGKSVQIHHIDEYPSNNSLDNLSVLCFECHGETQIKGGFGRKLDSTQILKYKREWILRVKERRYQADNLVSLKTTGSEKPSGESNAEFNYYEYLNNYRDEFLITKEQEEKRLENYLQKIVEIKKTVYKFAQPNWDTGVTMTMNQASYDIVDFYEEILNELSSFYPYKHFEEEPKKYFNELISAKYKWHRHIRETFGFGRNGTIVSTMAAGIVIVEVDKMVVEMVAELDIKYEICFRKWLTKWNKIK
jgi:hypothetical protein